MLLALIPPIRFLKKYATTNYHLVLGHLLAHQRYKDFYKAKRVQGDYLILDNAADEFKSSISIAVLLQLAGQIDAQEIVLPDTQWDLAETLRWTLKAVERKDVLNCGRKLQAVVQGKDKGEVLKCLTEYMHYPKIDVIGIPKLITPFFEGGRFEFCERVYALGFHIEKKFHLLGIWENPIELKEISSQFEWVRGVDTTAPIYYGSLGVKYHPKKGMKTKKIPKDDGTYFSAKRLAFPNIIDYNIKIMKEWCKGES